MEPIKPERIDKIEYVPEHTRPEFVIAIGTILAAIVLVLGYVGYDQYQKHQRIVAARQAVQALTQSKNQTQTRNMADIRAHQKQLREERQARADRARAEQIKKDAEAIRKRRAQPPSIKCKFWRQQAENGITERIKAMLQRHCI